MGTAIRSANGLHGEFDVIDASALAAVARSLAETVGRADVVEDVHALSAVQEAMLFHAVGSDADDVYIVQQRIEIDGLIDPDAFQAAWSLVVSRHPAVRSVFAWRHDGQPVQVVCRGVDVAVDLVDLQGVVGAERVIDDAFERDRSNRFDLAKPPLMRLSLFRLAADSHVLLWSQHHLLQDGWSSSVVLNEVFTAYAAIAAGETPVLAEVRPFREYITWLEDNDREDARAFWADHLAGFRQPTRMAAQPAEDGSYERRFRALTPELTTALRGFARQHRVSLNTVLVGALGVVLGRYSGRSDVVFGTVASGRPPTLPGVESMVGMFINTLPLRIHIDPKATVAEWLPSVQARQASLFDHEHSSLPDIQAWSELRPGTSLTDVLFAYWNFGGAGASPGDALTYRTVDGYGRTSFPFSITVEGADPINIGVDFDTADVPVALATRFLEHYANMLEAVVAGPDRTLSSLHMLTGEEQTALAEFNDTSAPVPYESVVAAFRSQAASTPDAVAVRDNDGNAVSYAQLDERSDRLAHGLLAGGQHRPLVGLFLERSVDMLVAVLAVLKAGGAYVPIDRHHPRDRIAKLVHESGADVVVTSAELAPLVRGASAEIVMAHEAQDAAAPSGEPPAVSGDDVAYVMFTSGSTGTPKGVEISHRSLINYVWWAAQVYGGGRPTTFPLYSSIAFDLTVTSVFVPLVTGGTVVVYPDHDARDLSVLDVFADDAVDVVKLTPSHLALLEPQLLETSRIRSLILGGEDLKATLAAETVAASGGNLTIFNEYGPTEATVGCMIHRFDPEADHIGSVPIGTPAANAQIYVLDEGLAPVPAGATGELYIGGTGVAIGYRGRSDLTNERFVPDPHRSGALMYRSGDLARWRGFGVLEYVGRIDEQVKVRGYRLELGEIEAALKAHPAVSEAAAALREPRPGDVRLAAYFVPSPDAGTNLTELRNHLQDQLPAYMVPPHLISIDALPITSNGKLDRDALPVTLGESVSSAAFVVPRNDAERLVAAISESLLGVERVSLGDNFFDLGGHSILAMQLIARLHEATGVRISPRVILLNTLEQAAALLPAGSAGDDSSEIATDGAEAMSTSAFFFGPSDGALFGLRHVPAPDTDRSHSVLVCPPVGWEYMRTHRALRGLARRLGRDGFTVLRFDYYATGDSFGADGSGSLTRWTDDVATAIAELAASETDGLTIVGMRLGASIAARALTRGAECQRLIAWDPVVSGAAHLADLERMHGEMLANRPVVAPEVLGDELLGFRYPRSLRGELRALDLLAEPWPDTATTVLASQPKPELAALGHRADAKLDYAVVADAGAWDDLSSAQSALLPTAIPSRIIELLRGTP